MVVGILPPTFVPNPKAMIPNTRRIKFSLSIVALLTVTACTNTLKTEPPVEQVAASDTIASPAQVPEIQMVNADSISVQPVQPPALNSELALWADSLQEYFDPVQLALLDRAVTQSKAIATAADLAQFYQGMLRDSIQPMVERKFQASCRHSDYGGFADDDWDWISGAFPFIATRVSCHNGANGTECMHEAPISLLPLKTLAIQTPQPEDDLYFDVVIAVHSGTEPGLPVETEVYDGREDYTSAHANGTVGMLGDGHTSDIVRKMAQAARARKLFNKALTADLRDLLNSLQEEKYYHTKASILTELDEIIATGTTSKLMTTREIAALQETQTWVRAKEEGFDCGAGGCDPAASLQEP
jgi:hypothetical protein